jgi:hypothetical protein
MDALPPPLFKVTGLRHCDVNDIGQERRLKASRPGESISFRFRGTTGWTRDLISATRIVPPTVKWDRFRVTRSNDCVSVCLFKREKEAFRLSFVPRSA